MGDIQGQTRSVLFYPAFTSAQSAFVSQTRIFAIASIVDARSNTNNVANAELNITINATLQMNGSVSFTTNNTSLHPNSIVNLLFFVGDRIG